MTTAIGEGYRNRSIFQELLCNRQGVFTTPGNQAFLPLQILSLVSKHILREVHHAPSRAHGERRVTPPKETPALLGGVVVDALILAIHVSHLIRSSTQTHSGDIHVRPNVLGQFSHVALAEALDLGLRLPVRVKVGAPHSGAHVGAGQCIGEGAVQGQGFRHRSIHPHPEVSPSLVGSQCTVVLDPKASVDTSVPTVIQPGHPELDETLRFQKQLCYPCIFGHAVKNWRNGVHSGRPRLNKLPLMTILAVSLCNKHLSCFESSLKSQISLSAKQRLVPPNFLSSS
mmetsp:Transcript_7023/g.9409  ORF Transcript_7023/g.9409 Transcript_7023/m.9409 type:complete len:285 (-) Transcript_7023:260-1114(-)